MRKLNLKKYSVFLYAALAIITAAVLRQIAFWAEDPLDWVCSFLRSVIYIGLFTAWGVSIRNRIIQPQVRRYLTAVSTLMVFWVTVRTIRYMFAEDPGILRYLWYMYYLPMLFIPLLAVFLALSLGKPERFRLPKWTSLLYIPTAALLLLVLSNDLHQLVFVFPPDASVWGDDYHYAAGYFLVIGWPILCALTALGIMVYKCRIPHSRKVFVMPFVPVVLALLYGVLYILRVPWLKPIAGDMTVIFCLLFAAALESCIQCGLIQSNMGYDKMFAASSFKGAITDPEFNLRSASGSFSALSKQTMERAAKGPVKLDRNTLLKCSRLKKGYVFWQEDISELAAVQEELELTQEELRDTGDILKAENEQRAHWLQITEENRLYGLIEKQTAPQIARLRELTEQLRQAGELTAARRLLSKLVVIGTFVKRRSNLIFAAGQKGSVDERELRLCLLEAASSLKLYGIECGISLDLEGPLPLERVNRVFDFFEMVVEENLDGITSVLFFAGQGTDGLEARMSISCGTELTVPRDCFPGLRTERDEDGIWYLLLSEPKGGTGG